VYGVAGFEREFALKRFHRRLLERPGARDQLKAAARLYAALEHPRIARLHEHSFERPDAFVAVELVTGLDLGRLVDATHGQGQPLPAGAATALISRAARAVGYGHGRGLSHLGLCPTNLICARTGEVKVTDFGFLPPRLGPSPETDDTLSSRLGYLAPEQLAAGAGSPATDVFALGAVFYELLTGRRAFAGRTAGEIAQSIRRGPPDLDAIPKPLARVLDRCFAASPFARYPGGSALADAIDAAARGMLMRGDRRDAARSVAGALERLAAIRGDQSSGALSFPIPRPPADSGPPSRTLGDANLSVPNLELDERVREDSTTDVRAIPTPPGERLPSSPPPIPPRLTPTPAPAPAMPSNPPTLDSDLVIELEPHPASDASATTPFVREPEPQPRPRPRPRPQPQSQPGLQAPPDAAAPFADNPLLSSPPRPFARNLLIFGGLLALGAIGFFGYLIVFGERAGKAAPAIDAAAIATGSADAAVARPPDAASADAAPVAEKLTITSKPEGATVYLDGAPIGETPISIDGSPDKHRLAVILPGHELHIADIPGGGDLAVELEEVTPTAGAGGIKVRCDNKNRYYVFVDGNDTGMLCPTERIGVKATEPHVVEIYDPVTDTRSRFDVEITQTRRSIRVKVD
jgi:serine/threonine-protein kinase